MPSSESDSELNQEEYEEDTDVSDEDGSEDEEQQENDAKASDDESNDNSDEEDELDDDSDEEDESKDEEEQANGNQAKADDESDEEDESDEDSVENKLKAEYAERIGKSLFLRFPRKLPADIHVKELNPRIIEVYRSRFPDARFCHVGFASTEDRQKAFIELKKVNVSGKRLYVSIPRNDSESIEDYCEKRKKAREDKLARKKLVKSMNVANKAFTSADISDEDGSGDEEEQENEDESDDDSDEEDESKDEEEQENGNQAKADDDESGEEYGSDEDSVENKLKAQYAERIGKSLFLRFPRKLPADIHVKELNPRIIEVYRSRFPDARFCHVGFASTEDRQKAFIELKKVNVSGKRLYVSIPRNDSESIEDYCEKRKKAIKDKLAREKLAKSMNVANKVFTSADISDKNGSKDEEEQENGIQAKADDGESDEEDESDKDSIENKIKARYAERIGKSLFLRFPQAIAAGTRVKELNPRIIKVYRSRLPDASFCHVGFASTKDRQKAFVELKKVDVNGKRLRVSIPRIDSESSIKDLCEKRKRAIKDKLAKSMNVASKALTYTDIKALYAERIGKSLFLRFPRKLTADIDVKKLNPRIIKVYRSRFPGSSFCHVGFASTEDREKAFVELEKVDVNGERLFVSIPRIDSESSIEDYCEKSKKAIKDKLARKKLPKSMYVVEEASTIQVKNIPRDATVSEVENLFPNAVYFKLTYCSSSDGTSSATVSMPTPKDATLMKNKEMQIGDNKLIISYKMSKNEKLKKENGFSGKSGKPKMSFNAKFRLGKIQEAKRMKEESRVAVL